MSRELRIDWTRCDGHGLCAQVMPSITLDEWGFPLIDGDIDEQDVRAARAAAAACAVLALRLERPAAPPRR